MFHGLMAHIKHNIASLITM